MAKAKRTPKIVTRSLDAAGFYSDFEKPGMLYAALIRSPAATGIVKDIKIPDLPEGYYLYTAADIPGSKTMTLNNTVTKVLGFDNVAYTGEPLGVVIGPDETELFELVDRAAIYFDVQNLESALKNVIKNQKKPAVAIPDSASTDFSSFVSELNDLPSLDAVIDNTHIEENPVKIIATRDVNFGIYEKDDYSEERKKIFESEKYVINETWSQELVNPKWHETNGAFCYTEGEKLHVYTPTKWTYFLQKILAETLKIDQELIYIHKTKTSGIYSDGLWRTTQLAVQAALGAYLLKKPVKLILSQKEQETFMAPGVHTNFSYKTAVSASGKIKAMEIEIELDVGSQNPFAQEIADRLTIASCNYYKPENLKISTIVKTSKNPPTTINIKGVDSQAFFAIENQIQKISSETGIFPDEIRYINSELPKGMNFPFEIDHDRIFEITRNTISMSDFNRKYASFHMEAIDRVEKDSAPFFALPLRGIGISNAYNISGYHGESTFSYFPKIEVTLEPEEKLSIHTIQPSEVNQDIWKTTAASILQIPKSNIRIDSSFIVEEIPKSPEDTFSNIGIINQLVKRCCNDIQKKRFHQPLPITSRKGATPGTKAVWNKETFSGNPFMSNSLISCVVEVELDTYTYNEKLRGIWITIDCGEILDEAAAVRTVKLEVQKELSMLVKGKNVSCDDISITFFASKNKAGQLGELVHNALPAAFASALSVALATQVTKLPCTEANLFRLIKARGESNTTEEKGVETL